MKPLDGSFDDGAVGDAGRIVAAGQTGDERREPLEALLVQPPQFDNGLAIEPDDPQARTNRAGALLREGRLDEAIADLEEVLRVTPDFLPARKTLEIMRNGRREP